VLVMKLLALLVGPKDRHRVDLDQGETCSQAENYSKRDDCREGVEGGGAIVGKTPPLYCEYSQPAYYGGSHGRPAKKQFST
jgi:hypothetical protein